MIENEESSRAIIEAVPNAILVVDRTGTITLVNSQTESLFKYSRNELIGQKVEILLPNKMREAHPGHRESFLKNPKPRPMGAGRDLFGQRKDGVEIPIEIGLSPMKTTEGTFILASIIDISERKKIERSIKEANLALVKINRELDEFAYIVSHDLKAPLRAIGSVVDWLILDYDDKLDDQGKKHLATLKNRVERMGNLIDGVLRYARIGKDEFENEWVDINKIIQSCLLALEIPPTITIDVQKDLPLIYGAKILFEQIFQNLISNSVKYMDKSKGLIEVSCSVKEKFWHFLIKDNGPGIEEEHFDRIFKIFQTLNPRSKIESTGIGLTIVKKVILIYGGEIWIESKVNHGTTVNFTLPRQNLN